MSKKRSIQLCCLAVPALAALAMSPPVHAFTFGTAYMTSWSGCDSECAGATPLSYTDDQILMFESAMIGYGHTHTHRYVNQSVWASDLVEDTSFGGGDRYYSDDGDVYAYSGHGTSNDAGGTFLFPACHGGSVDSCLYDAEMSRFGERSSGYASPAPGNMRFIILGTCRSVDNAPHMQWDQALRYGSDIIMGYRGLSADSENTDEVMEDLAIEAFGGSDDFKPAWFYAVEDWWVNDVGGIVASGVDAGHAVYRRDNLDRGYPRRPATEAHNYFAWAYHDG